MSTFDIQERRIGGVTTLDLDGDIRIGGGNIELQKAIRCHADEGRNQIVLNFIRVNYIDSSGLGELVAGQVLLNKKSGWIKLINLSKRLLDLMMITKLNTVFDIYDDELEALNSLKIQDGVTVPVAPPVTVETIITLP